MINKDKEVGGTHYAMMRIEPIELIEALRLDFKQGSIIKYISRYKSKGHPLEDLEKALHYCRMYNDAVWETISYKDRMLVKMYCMLNGLDDRENAIIGYTVMRQYERCAEEIGKIISKLEEA